MSIGSIIEQNVMPPLIAALMPLVEKKVDGEIPRLEVIVERVLKEKLDELVPDSIDKNIPKILDQVAGIVPKVANQIGDLIPNLINKGFNMIPGINIGGFHL